METSWDLINKGDLSFLRAEKNNPNAKARRERITKNVPFMRARERILIRTETDKERPTQKKAHPVVLTLKTHHQVGKH